MKENYGVINGHVVGRILKETVRRATVVIRNERLIFDSEVKEGYNGKMDDVCTSADRKAQEVYVLAVLECFPDFGIIAEEEIEGANGPGHEQKNYFTIDPLDGTKAYTRRQSHGVGTMVAMVRSGEVVSAYVGDINTEEIYGYRPGSDKVHRITRLNTAELLDLRLGKLLHETHALLRDPSDTYSPEVRELLKRFKGHEVIGSSIGIWMAQLWKGEVAAAFMGPGWETPWDSTPVIGISKKLDCAFLRPDGHGGWEEFDPVPPRKVYRRDHVTIVTPRCYAHHFIGK